MSVGPPLLFTQPRLERPLSLGSVHAKAPAPFSPCLLIVDGVVELRIDTARPLTAKDDGVHVAPQKRQWLLGGGWQRGQKKLERFMKCSRRIGVPQRSHGRPSCPYAASFLSK